MQYRPNSSATYSPMFLPIGSCSLESIQVEQSNNYPLTSILHVSQISVIEALMIPLTSRRDRPA